MSFLRKQRQAERQAKTESSSLLQKTFTYSKEALVLALAFWGYKQLAKFISPVITYGGLVAIAIIYVSLRVYLKKYPQRWITGNHSELVSSIPITGNVFFIIIGLALIAPRVIDLVSPPPEIGMTLSKAPGRYAEGFDVEGIKWRKDFYDYRFVFKNKDASVELTDVRIDLQFRAGVVKSTIVASKGVDTISAAPFGMTAAKGNKAGERTNPIVSYKMILLITAVRVFPNAEFTTRIILMDPFVGKTLTGDSPNDKNDMCVSFYYDDFWGNKTKQSRCYPLLQDKQLDESTLSIDLNNPISPETRKLGSGVVFDQPQNAKGLNMILSPD